MITQSEPSYLPGFTPLPGREGYHSRDNGRKCPRGHTGPFRDSKHDCAECRKIFSPSWKLIRTAVKSAIHGGAIPPACSRAIGATSPEFVAFLRDGCQRLGYRLADHGRTWGVYHVKHLHEFDLETEAGFRAANRLANLRVRRLHNGIHCASTEPTSPELFPDDY